ncbi:hypothetical protein [Streptomyces sp. NPDC017529]|uniref:hypothetical protein n=1 Tax=Streptomyces sp. NPDC017529 TaxID=3365000 RepID=UPI0037884539
MKYTQAAALLAGAALSVGIAAPAFADQTGADKFRSGLTGTVGDTHRAVTTLGGELKKINGALRGDEQTGALVGDSAAVNAPNASGIGIQSASLRR